MKLIQVYSISKKTTTILAILSFNFFTIDFKIEILINHIVRMEYFNDSLPILQNFEKTIWVQEIE